MSQIQLYIDDKLVDLSNASAIALTLQVNNLANLADRQSTFSNLFELPKTANNRAIFGYPDVDSFTQSQPYRYLNAKYIVNGIEVIPAGQSTITEASDSFKVQITFGIKGFAELIEDKTLQDLSQIDNYGYQYTAQSLSDVVNSQTNTEGFIWPLIDYGQLGLTTIDINKLRPAAFTTAIMRSIQDFTGYKFSGDVFDYSEYKKEIIPFSNDEYIIQAGSSFNLPDMSIKDFLKDFMQRYFLTPVVDNYKKTIYFFSFDRLYLNKSQAIDWSDKFVNDTISNKFSNTNYARLNNLKMKPDDAVSKTLGNTSFSIDNETLSASKDLITSVYAGSENLDFGILRVARIIRTTPNSQDYTQNVEPRVLVDYKEPQAALLFTDNFNSQIATVVSTPHFKRSGSAGAGYDEHLVRYGQGLMTLLKKYREVSRRVKLDAMDILNLRFDVPVYDAKEAKYYYINKINNWLPGRTCTVDLIRM